MDGGHQLAVSISGVFGTVLDHIAGKNTGKIRVFLGESHRDRADLICDRVRLHVGVDRRCNDRRVTEEDAEGADWKAR